MADDWQAGDLALCLRNPGPKIDPWEPVVGGVYSVIQVGSTRSGEPWLNLAEDPTAETDSGWDMFWFAKIRPLTNEERDKFIADLRTPVREPGS
jgi:hypothetical protein